MNNFSLSSTGFAKNTFIPHRKITSEIVRALAIKMAIIFPYIIKQRVQIERRRHFYRAIKYCEAHHWIQGLKYYSRVILTFTYELPIYFSIIYGKIFATNPSIRYNIGRYFNFKQVIHIFLC